jgi:hypothetical protein
MRKNDQKKNPSTRERQKKLDRDEPVIVRLGEINIIHYDHPSQETIRKRTEQVLQGEASGEAFSDDCQLCQEFRKHPHDWVYYQQDESELGEESQ